jgi:NADP-dependent 3-hydroxy acid dehydrogenase YdfG
VNRVIVITGASSGIGAALARRLGRAGDRIVLAARREPEMRAVAAELGDALVVRADVTVRADVERIRNEALSKYGQVDVWVNNAGRGMSKSVLDLTDDDLDLMVLVNVKSAMYGMQAILPHFLERGRGHVLNVSSFLGKVPVAAIRAAYSAAKAMLNSLTANVRMELASHPDIHITLVLPGLVATAFARNAVGGTPSYGPPPTAPFGPQSADDVAAAIATAIDQPVGEVYTNPPMRGTVVEYMKDVDAFERRSRTR